MTVAELQAILARCPPNLSIELDCGGAYYLPTDVCIWEAPRCKRVLLLTSDKMTSSHVEIESRYRKPVPLNRAKD